MEPAIAPVQPLCRKGLTQAFGAYVLWGLLPLYFAFLAHVTAWEVVAMRILGSVVLLGAIILMLGRWEKLRSVLANRRTIAMLMASAALISVNWLVYIWAVQHHQVLAASLGYFLNPLVNVLLGVTLLGERLNRVQGAAIALAAAGVAVLASGAGAALWISLALAFSFGFYGLVRKLAPVESLEGLGIETAILTPFAAGWMFWQAGHGGVALGSDAATTTLLLTAGAITAVPLLLFAAAARRLPLTVLGLIQYLAPTMQFVLAISVFGEVMTTAHLICFSLIWAGLVLFAGNSWIGSRRRAVAAG
ncbi:EamA family transporter RarD [Sphingomonas sp. BGYR3]|uniref:EamA family transporter RarD n=1 Tax=Sphingomonas sp. BGYR3 TaxID=2975483 RepID=UPI0021A6ABFF|nr:EamA family transporter RarD [Sphingomonas sp. BGYR3]